MKLAYLADKMLQVEVVRDQPGGVVVAVEPAQAREAWTSILESQRWLEIRAGYGQDPSKFIVRLQTNVEEIRPNEIAYWMNALIPDEQEPTNVLLGNAGESPDITWWIASLDRQGGTWVIEMFHLDTLRAWEENNLNALPGITIYHLGAKAVVGPMVVAVLAGVGHKRGDLGVSVGLAGESSPLLSAALVADSGQGWRMKINASNAPAEAQIAALLFREGEDPGKPILGVAIGW
jgi:hypothetical protein